MDSGINKGLYFAWVVAMVATLGSLYFSEIAHFMPCELCWFQRICMYPLSVILGIACFRNDRKIAVYVLPLTLIGSLFSIVHILEQKLGVFTRVCTEGVPCSGEYIHWFGFMTIPMLALIAFLLISVAMIMNLLQKKDEND
ncbi:disulfide bond formation protein DsbB [Pullulanibacillus pueri]|uniref:Disulfide bond formation protein C n=1 Tax=Pullulanibacillus pueri TaxID=1437324 RepID=A0A8J3ENQ2_9BACL|nr:disulfide oxidoreductase [Pullulanibacillus pueri]MBM7683694.1 disulfide bond formation protein DsbB [Pullulanibacillus pueri]GGH85248.1 disulfide bond formation protein C [Pullulanibacillus pueri]